MCCLNMQYLRPSEQINIAAQLAARKAVVGMSVGSKTSWASPISTTMAKPKVKHRDQAQRQK